MERYLRAVPAAATALNRGREPGAGSISASGLPNRADTTTAGHHPSHFSSLQPLDISAFTLAFTPLRQFTLHLVHAILQDLMPLLLRRSHHGGPPYQGMDVDTIRLQTRWDRRHAAQLGDLKEVIEAFEFVFFRIEREFPVPPPQSKLGLQGHDVSVPPKAAPAVWQPGPSTTTSTTTTTPSSSSASSLHPIARVFAYTTSLNPYALYARVIARLFPSCLGGNGNTLSSSSSYFLALSNRNKNKKKKKKSDSALALPSNAMKHEKENGAGQQREEEEEEEEESVEAFFRNPYRHVLPVTFPMAFIGEALGWGRFFAPLCGPLPRLMTHCGRRTEKATLLPVHLLGAVTPQVSPVAMRAAAAPSPTPAPRPGSRVSPPSENKNHNSPRAQYGLKRRRTTACLVFLRQHDTDSVAAAVGVRVMQESVEEDLLWLQSFDRLCERKRAAAAGEGSVKPTLEGWRRYSVCLEELVEELGLTVMQSMPSTERTKSVPEAYIDTDRHKEGGENFPQLLWAESYLEEVTRTSGDYPPPIVTEPHATGMGVSAAAVAVGRDGEQQPEERQFGHTRRRTLVSPTLISRKTGKPVHSGPLDRAVPSSAVAEAPGGSVSAKTGMEPMQLARTRRGWGDPPLVAQTLLSYVLHRFPLQLRVIASQLFLFQPDQEHEGTALSRFAACPLAPHVIPYLPTLSAHPVQRPEDASHATSIPTSAAAFHQRRPSRPLSFRRLQDDILEWEPYMTSFTASWPFSSADSPPSSPPPSSPSSSSSYLATRPIPFRWTPVTYYHPSVHRLVSAMAQTSPTSPNSTGSSITTTAAAAAAGVVVELQSLEESDIRPLLFASSDDLDVLVRHKQEGEKEVKSPWNCAITTISLLSVFWAYTSNTHESVIPSTDTVRCVGPSWRRVSLDGLVLQWDSNSIIKKEARTGEENIGLSVSPIVVVYRSLDVVHGRSTASARTFVSSPTATETGAREVVRPPDFNGNFLPDTCEAEGKSLCHVISSLKEEQLKMQRQSQQRGVEGIPRGDGGGGDTVEPREVLLSQREGKMATAVPSSSASASSQWKMPTSPKYLSLSVMEALKMIDTLGE